MREPTIVLSCIGAFALAGASPYIASLGGDFSDPATRHGLFYAWFYVLPIAADQWLWPESDALTLALVLLVFTVQYLALFGVVAALWRLATFAKDFVRPYRHRSGLVRWD